MAGDPTLSNINVSSFGSTKWGVFWSLGSVGKQYFSQLSFLGCKCNKLEDLVKLQQEFGSFVCWVGWASASAQCVVHSLSLRMGSSRMKLLRFLL